jgi:UrcA family protein
MSLRRIVPLVIAALALTAPAAFADNTSRNDESFSIGVRTSDLNLNSDTDAKVLLRRIQTAAGHGCGDKPNMVELSRMRVFNLCVGASVDATVARIGNPKLTALNYQSRPLTTLAQSR